MSGTVGRPGFSDIETAEGLLDESRGFFSAVERVLDFFGFDTAADNLGRYRSGKGGTHTYTDEDIAAHTALLEAEDRNRTEFERGTFTGRTAKPWLNAKLLGLEDGEEYGFEDYWQADTTLSRPSTYFAFGRNKVESHGGFLARREGDHLTLRGTVAHGFSGRERFDFNPGQPGSSSASMLEDAGEAEPFTMAFEREQDVGGGTALRAGRHADAAPLQLGRRSMTDRARGLPAKLLFCLKLALLGAVLFFVLTLVPVKQYVPVCGWPDGHALRGPMRPQFVGLLAQAMAEEGFRYFRNGETILVPIWPMFDGRDRFGWTSFQLNLPWRMAANIARGVQIGPHFYRPPAPVLRLLETEGPYGPYPRQKEGNSARYGPDYRFVEDCNLFRAAVLKVEAMPSEALPDLNAIDRARHARAAERPVPRP